MLYPSERLTGTAGVEILYRLRYLIVQQLAGNLQNSIGEIVGRNYAVKDIM